MFSAPKIKVISFLLIAWILNSCLIGTVIVFYWYNIFFVLCSFWVLNVKLQALNSIEWLLSWNVTITYFCRILLRDDILRSFQSTTTYWLLWNWDVMLVIAWILFDRDFQWGRVLWNTHTYEIKYFFILFGIR